MEAYQIHELERMTGIKAHTIRIWEKRYSLIRPNRTTTNRRFYSDTQVKKLLNVSTLLAQGRKISKIAALSDDEIDNEIQSLSQQDVQEHEYGGYINDLVKSMLDFDETAFEKIFSAATLRFGIYDTMVNVIYPFLGKVGILWSLSKAAPIQEHFAACIIKKKLMAAIDGLMPPKIKTKTFLLFLPPGEWHEIGLLFANYIIRVKGYKTIYLGQDLPIENIEKIMQIIKPTHALLFYITTRPKEEIAQQIKMISKIDDTTQLLIAGNLELLPENKSKIKNVTYLTQVDSLYQYL